MQKHLSSERISRLPEMPRPQSWRSRQSVERELRDLQNAYARLMEEHASLWSGGLLMGSLQTLRPASRTPEFSDELQELIEASLNEILGFCGEALSDLQNASADGDESNKHIGKILAYGRVTAILHRLQSRVQMHGTISVTARHMNPLASTRTNTRKSRRTDAACGANSSTDCNSPTLIRAFSTRRSCAAAFTRHRRELSAGPT
jgi:hypothetical protein